MPVALSLRGSARLLHRLSPAIAVKNKRIQQIRTIALLMLVAHFAVQQMASAQSGDSQLLVGTSAPETAAAVSEYPTTAAPPIFLPPPQITGPFSASSTESANVAAKESPRTGDDEHELLPIPDFDDTATFHEPVDAGPVWYAYPMHWLETTAWDTGIELGINGSTGSNEATSVRTGGYIRRESEFGKIDISVYYNKTTADGEETQNNAQLDIRNDWKFNNTSKWSLYGTGTAFYDRFQNFDLQVNASGGVGYRLFDAYGAQMTTRAGGGASRELGGLNEDWIPEAHFGFDYNQQITKRQKLYTTLDYFPEMDGFNEFRMVTDVGWELELDKPTNMSLKLSMTDRYDSTPSDADEPRLLNYSVLLLWKL